MALTFKGRIPSTPFCIDDFRPSLIDSFQHSPLSNACPLIFLLSHLHTDHTRGLSPSWHHGCILTSPLTRHLLLARYSLDPSLIHSIPYNTPTSFPLSPHSPLTFTLTLFPTLHCPGSCLFLLDGYFGRHVYTGDLRYLTPLAPSLLSLPCDLLYLDDTFAHHAGPFLHRADAVRAVVRVARRHGGCRVLWNGDLLGKEDVAVMVGRRLGCRVAVEEDKYRVLRALWDAGYDLNEQQPPQPPPRLVDGEGGGMGEGEDGEGGEGAEDEGWEREEDVRALSHPTWLEYFTTDKRQTPVHMAPKGLVTRARIRALNAAAAPGEPRTVGVLMTGWAPEQTSEESDDSCCFYTVRYSSHSSQEELKALVTALRPAVMRGISTGGSSDWCRELLSGAGEKAIEVPRELTEGLWKDVGPVRQRGLRRRRSEAMTTARRVGRRGFVLDHPTAHSADEAEEEVGEDAAAEDGEVVEEIRLLADDQADEVEMEEDYTEAERTSASAAAPPAAAVDAVTVEEDIRRFSLPCNRARERFIPRLSLSAFEVLETDLPLPPSPRRLPSFLSSTEPSAQDQRCAMRVAPAPPARSRSTVPSPFLGKARARGWTRQSLPLQPSSSVLSSASPLPPPRLPASAVSTAPACVRPIAASSSSPPFPSLLDSLQLPPHTFPALALQARPGSGWRAEKRPAAAERDSCVENMPPLEP